MNVNLTQLDPQLKHFLVAFVLLLNLSVLIGLVFVYQTTQIQSKNVTERYAGSSITSEEDIPDSYPKPIAEMLLNTHNHLFGFAFIFLSMGIIFYFNSTIYGILKYILLVEPFASVVLTFGGLWGIRFVDSSFLYIVVIAGIATYLSFFIMAIVVLFELLFKK